MSACDNFFSADYAVEALKCPYCGSNPGYRCTTKSGKQYSYPHAARTRPIYEAFGAGMAQAECEAYDLILRSPDHARKAAQRHVEKRHGDA